MFSQSHDRRRIAGNFMRWGTVNLCKIRSTKPQQFFQVKQFHVLKIFEACINIYKIKTWIISSSCKYLRE
ncbi:unnamed protein product [Rhizophagus irregularis]|nr:unnamed protein product [Rhizophagus irregularis]